VEELLDFSQKMRASVSDDPQQNRLRRIDIGVSSLSAIARRAAGALPAAAFAAIVLMLPQFGLAEPAHPFAKFLGNWRGAGQVVGANGSSERISCRASYSALQDGDALSQTLVCASDSYRIDIRSHVVAVGQQVQGRWEETTRQATGDLVGHIANGAFEGNVTGPGFVATMSLRAVGRRQFVNIQPQGGDIAKVEINLSREADR
jgi:hypothetical protein